MYPLNSGGLDAAVNTFVDVLITSKSCNQLSVGFQGDEILGLVR